jgi:hypothetical protein
MIMGYYVGLIPMPMLMPMLMLKAPLTLSLTKEDIIKI